ncbi:MAG: O-acetyl-ADP-ribose deacetylase [Candidatus Caldatribacteriaceae bacterium]
MEVKIGSCRLSLIQGDITRQKTEAIVNAANARLAGGGGVDGAIHRAGGPKIAEECRKIGGCPTGKAVITGGGNLQAKYVIHAVGPIYRGGKHNEAELLRSAYLSSLTLAKERAIASLSFPSLSTGAYGYPVKEAARVALQTILDFMAENPEGPPREIVFVLYTPQDLEVYRETLQELQKERGIA